MIEKVSTIFIFFSCLWLVVVSTKSMDECSIQSKYSSSLVRSDRSAFKPFREINMEGGYCNAKGYVTNRAAISLQTNPSNVFGMSVNSAPILQPANKREVTNQSHLSHGNINPEAIIESTFAASQNVSERDIAVSLICESMRVNNTSAEIQLNEIAQSTSQYNRDTASRVICKGMECHESWAHIMVFVLTNSEDIYGRDTISLAIFKGIQENAVWVSEALEELGKSHIPNHRDIAARTIYHGLHINASWAHTNLLIFAKSTNKFVRDTAARVIYIGKKMGSLWAQKVFDDLEQNDNLDAVDTARRTLKFKSSY